MTSSKNTKRALLASVLSVVLCAAMLVGSTFAWFTDSVTSGNNKIIAGNLDVNLSYTTNGTVWTDVGETTNLFKTDTLWEPGHMEVAYLKVENLGSLALKYQLSMNAEDTVTSTSVLGNEIALSNYLKYTVVELTATDGEIALYDRASAQTALESATEYALNVPYNSGDAVLYPEDNLPQNEEGAASEKYIALIVYMPEDVGNEANYKTGAAIPQITLGINLVATQTPYEEDSFGPDYDAGAAYPHIRSNPIATVDGTSYDLEQPENLAIVLASPAGSDITLSGDLTLAEPITFANPVSITFENSLITYETDANEQKYLITVQDGTVINMDAASSIVMNGNAETQASGRDLRAIYSNGVLKAGNIAGTIVINNARGRGIYGASGVEIESFSGSIEFNNPNGDNRYLYGIVAYSGDVNIKNFTGDIKIDFGRGNSGFGVAAQSGSVSIDHYAGSIDVQTNVSHNAFGIYANHNVTIGDFTGSVYARGGSGSGFGVYANSGDVAISSISGSISGDSFNSELDNSQWNASAIYARGSVYGTKDGEAYTPIQVTGTLSSTVGRTAAFTVEAGDKLYMDVEAGAVVKAQSSYHYGIAPVGADNWGGGAVNFVAEELHVTCDDGSNVTAVSQTKDGTPVESICTVRQLSSEAATLLRQIPYGKECAQTYIGQMSDAAKNEFENWNAIVAYVNSLE